MPKFDFNFKNWKGFSEIPSKTKLLVLLLIGLILLVIALPTKKTDNSESTFDTVTSTDEDTDTDSSHFLDSSEYSEYEKLLETRIEDALAKVEGVGNVSVMITLKSSAEEVIDKDTSSESSSTSDSTQNSTSKTSIYSQNADGSQTPYVKKIYTPKIEGVIVIADGGDDSVVIQNISESIQALFGVEAHKIKIMKRSSS